MSVTDLGKPFTLNRLSYSAMSKYMECPQKFYLTRVGGLDRSTWFVTLMGTVVHHITEQADLARAGLEHVEGETTPGAFAALFDREVAQALERGVEVKASGRELKTCESWSGGRNKKDADWCKLFGPVIIEQWGQWRDNNPEFQLATMPDGSPGTEVNCDFPVKGVNFLGYIDRVFVTDHGEPVVVDLKTGSIPADGAQLRTYAYQLRRLHDVDPVMAGFWGRVDGTKPDDIQFDIVDWEATPAGYDATLEYQVESTATGMEAGVFYANPGAQYCGKACPVRDYCKAVDGRYADEIPLPAPVHVRRSGETQGGALVTSKRTTVIEMRG